MTIPWRSAGEVFTSILRERGVEPDGVEDTATAWEAFTTFAQLPLDGLADPDEDSDAILVSWGRWGWNGHEPALSLMRQLIPDGDDQEIWQISLTLIFSETAETAAHRSAETPFDFARPGAERETALRSASAFAPLRTALTVRPVRSELTVEHVC